MTQERESGAAMAGHGHLDEAGGGENVPATVVVGVIGALLLFVAVVVLQALFFSAQRSELHSKVVAIPSEQFTRLVSEQQALLGSYRWIDQSKGRVGIPIDRAMELEAAVR